MLGMKGTEVRLAQSKDLNEKEEKVKRREMK